MAAKALFFLGLQPTDSVAEAPSNQKAEKLKPPSGTQSLSSPRARAKKLLAAATNTSLTALAELADYGMAWLVFIGR